MRPLLASTLHDPEDRLYAQLERVLPTLEALFGGIAIQPTPETPERTLAALSAAGARIGDALPAAGVARLGRARRDALAVALADGRPHVFLCDFDRALHWVESHPGELAALGARIAENDFTVLGRTERAFASHPAHQRDTEVLINRVFQAVSGLDWDVTAGARGLSHAGARAIVEASNDDAISTDVTWPLLLRATGRFSVGYLAVEGLEFETADRHPDEVAAAGGVARWLDVLDRDPRHWAHRFEVARLEVEALVPYADRA